MELRHVALSDAFLSTDFAHKLFMFTIHYEFWYTVPTIIHCIVSSQTWFGIQLALLSKNDLIAFERFQA